MKNIIAITGEIASGKGATSQILSEKLKYEIYKASTSIREFCVEHNIDVNEFQDYVAKRPEFDNDIEKKMGEYANTHDNYIIEARMGWYVAPFAFKVFLTVDIETAANRIIKADRGEAESYSSFEEAVLSLKTRFESESCRWKSLYDVDIHDKSNFDLVIDTTNILPEEVAYIIINEYNKKRKEEGLLIE